MNTVGVSSVEKADPAILRSVLSQLGIDGQASLGVQSPTQWRAVALNADLNGRRGRRWLYSIQSMI